jgi:hypothetical protein
VQLASDVLAHVNITGVPTVTLVALASSAIGMKALPDNATVRIAEPEAISRRPDRAPDPTGEKVT